MGQQVYNVTVPSNTANNFGDLTSSKNYDNCYFGDPPTWGWSWGWPYNWYQPYKYQWFDYASKTVYKYQITCPVCQSNSNWCELNKTTICKCGAVLKAVTSIQPKTYEVPVKQ